MTHQINLPCDGANIADITRLFSIDLDQHGWCNQPLKLIPMSTAANHQPVIHSNDASREEYFLARYETRHGYARVPMLKSMNQTIVEQPIDIRSIADYMEYQQLPLEIRSQYRSPLVAVDLTSIDHDTGLTIDQTLNSLVGFDDFLNHYNIAPGDVYSLHAGAIKSFHGFQSNARGTGILVDWTTELGNCGSVPHNLRTLDIRNYTPADSSRFLSNNFEAISTAGRLGISIDLSRGIRLDELRALLELCNHTDVILFRTSLDDRIEPSDEKILAVKRFINKIRNGLAFGRYVDGSQRKDVILGHHIGRDYRPIHRIGRSDILNIVMELSRSVDIFGN